VLVLPQQQPANNPHRCFNWFLADDIERDKGEALSIRQMVEAMIRDHDIDRRQVFVAGLSAGGAMTSVMLATYPETFAGGGIVAGLPYGTAASMKEALDCMSKARDRSPREWGDLVRAASSHRTGGHGRAYRCGTAATIPWSDGRMPTRSSTSGLTFTVLVSNRLERRRPRAMCGKSGATVAVPNWSNAL
jgi:poly(3-hydroxybutyrate) depolymerase